MLLFPSSLSRRRMASPPPAPPAALLFFCARLLGGFTLCGSRTALSSPSHQFSMLCAMRLWPLMRLTSPLPELVGRPATISAAAAPASIWLIRLTSSNSRTSFDAMTSSSDSLRTLVMSRASFCTIKALTSFASFVKAFRLLWRYFSRNTSEDSFFFFLMYLSPTIGIVDGTRSRDFGPPAFACFAF